MNARLEWLLVCEDDNDPALLPERHEPAFRDNRRPISASPRPSYIGLPMICGMLFGLCGFLWLFGYGSSDCITFIDQDAIDNCKEENKEAGSIQRFVFITSILAILVPFLRMLVLLNCSRDRIEAPTLRGLP